MLLTLAGMRALRNILLTSLKGAEWRYFQFIRALPCHSLSLSLNF